MNPGLSQLSVILALLACSALAWSETLSGKVVAIADGDSLTVLDANRIQHKVRLAGIDAPEKAQPFGRVSRKNLSRLVFDKTVTVEFEKTDRYDRLVGRVLVDSLDVCLAQVKAGLAWWYRKYSHEQSIQDRAAYWRRWQSRP